MIASQALPRSKDPATSTRLLCVDILRGLVVAGMILVDNPGDDNLAYRALLLGLALDSVAQADIPEDMIFAPA